MDDGRSEEEEVEEREEKVGSGCNRKKDGRRGR